MAVSVVAHIGFAPTGTSSSINTTGATLLVAGVCSFGGTTLSDSKGNTWTLLRSGNNASLTIWLYVALNPIVGAGHTFTLTSGFPNACVVAFSGINSVQDLDTGAPANFVSSASSIAVTAFTPKYDNSLIVSYVGSPNTGTFSINSGMSITDQVPGVASNEGGAFAWIQQGSAASITPTWSWSGSFNAVMACLVFTTNPTGAGGGSGGAWAYA